MKKNILITILLIFNTYTYANKRFVIETDRSISKIVLINSNGSERKLISSQTDNTNFSFEINDLENLFIEVSETANLKMYSVSEKISSSWYKIEGGEKKLVKSFFENSIFKNIKLEDFYIRSFMTNPLTGSDTGLRAFDDYLLNSEVESNNLVNSFFNIPNNFNFVRPTNLHISWKQKAEIVDLSLMDKTDFLNLYWTKDFKDTLFSYQNVSDELKSLLKKEHKYCLILKIKNSDVKYNQIVEYKLDFEFNEIVFAKKQAVQFFLTKHDIQFSWQSPNKKMDISILDEYGNVVFSKKKFSGENINFEYLNSKNIKIEKRKKYTLKLENSKNEAYKEFYFLQENQFPFKINAAQ